TDFTHHRRRGGRTPHRSHFPRRPNPALGRRISPLDRRLQNHRARLAFQQRLRPTGEGQIRGATRELCPRATRSARCSDTCRTGSLLPPHSEPHLLVAALTLVPPMRHFYILG